MRWDLSPAEAVQLQKTLRKEIRLEPYAGPLQWIAGADVSFNKYSPTVYAGFVVLDGSTMQVVDAASAVMDVAFPYMPGLLSFREIPPLLKAWKKLKTQPDVVIFDGHGIAHPRRLGIASHAGLLLDIPTLGCGKSRLTGVFDELGPQAGALTPLMDRAKDEQIGWALRTKKNTNPVFISPGHRMSLVDALRITQHCLKGYRLPEATRQAHLYVNEVRRAHLPTTENNAPQQ